MSAKIFLANTSTIFAQYDPLTSVAAWRQESGRFRQRFMKELGDHNTLNRAHIKSCINWGKHVTKIIDKYSRAELLKEEHGVEIDKNLAAEFKVIIKDYRTESEYIIPLSTPARPVDTTQVAVSKKPTKRKKDIVVEEATVVETVIGIMPTIETVPAEQPIAVPAAPTTPPPSTTTAEVPKRKLTLKLKDTAAAPVQRSKPKLVLKTQTGK
jgi:hypothetical protein